MTDLVVREYGSGIESVITLHGGPAAAGDVAPLVMWTPIVAWPP
jgi:hypothetical protein